MPRRRRWDPVRGTGSRIHDPWERLLLGALDIPGRATLGLGDALGLRSRPEIARETLREVLVLRLDRIGDVLMSLPAIGGLRAALPRARIRLAVGEWAREVVRHAPVDEVLVWSVPWAGRRDEGALGAIDLLQRARALSLENLDLAIDLQGDIRASVLMRMTGARIRVGYANTGGSWLLTHVVPLDETVSWVEQNRRAIETALGAPVEAARVDALSLEDREGARRFLEERGLAQRRPLVGLHPSGGRRVKQWDVSRWAEVGTALQRRFGATIVVTGSRADRPLAEELLRAMPERTVDTTGQLDVRGTMAMIEALDLFLSPDTGPMHMAQAVGTPSVSIFGPSDPVRFLSKGTGAPGSRHVALRADLFCAPCNLIRKPPRECDAGAPPECLRLVGVDSVVKEASRLLREAGFPR